MKLFKSLFLIAAASATISCSSIYKAFHAEKGDSGAPASSFTQALHPCGTLEEAMCRCSTGSVTQRRIFVYMPEEYGKNPSERFPVLYLLHGARGNETSWVTEGAMMQIVDSLVNNSLAVPSIIVLPNVNQYYDDEDFASSRFKKPCESLFEIDGTVETAFMKDVVGYVDSHYRTLADKQHRAIAGLSVGGLQTIFISASNPDAFGYVGLFSPMYKTPIRESEYSSFYDNLLEKQKIQFSNPPALYSIYIGHFDFFIFHMEYYRSYLNRNSFPFQYYETPGDHNWPNWRQYLIMFYQECFK